jgi:hypothetical protein
MNAPFFDDPSADLPPGTWLENVAGYAVALSPTDDPGVYEARVKPRPAEGLAGFRADPERALSVVVRGSDRRALPALAVGAVEQILLDSGPFEDDRLDGVTLRPAKEAPAAGFWADADPHDLVGTGVYVKFQDAGRAEPVEYMWVAVLAVAPDGRLAGRLGNHPVALRDYRYGQPVLVALDEVLDVDRGARERPASG